jgi:hypothetical protein
MTITVADSKEAHNIYRIGQIYSSVGETLQRLGDAPIRKPGLLGLSFHP